MKNTQQLGFAAYQKLAARTQNPDADAQTRLEHAALGLCAETCELHSAVSLGHGATNASLIKEELGDVLWMLAELSDMLGLRMLDLFSKKNLGEANLLFKQNVKASRGISLYKHYYPVYAMKFAAQIAGHVQKLLQGHPLEEKHVAFYMQGLFSVLPRIARMYGFSVRHAMWANIEKLKARYPDGFSAQRSIHR